MPLVLAAFIKIKYQTREISVSLVTLICLCLMPHVSCACAGRKTPHRAISDIRIRWILSRTHWFWLSLWAPSAPCGLRTQQRAPMLPHLLQATARPQRLVKKGDSWLRRATHVKKSCTQSRPRSRARALSVLRASLSAVRELPVGYKTVSASGGRVLWEEACGTSRPHCHLVFGAPRRLGASAAWCLLPRRYRSMQGRSTPASPREIWRPRIPSRS